MKTFTLDCPKCGAPARQEHNCEYCGSVFLGLKRAGIDTSRYIRDTGDAFCFQGLRESIERYYWEAKTKSDFGCLDISPGSMQVLMLKHFPDKGLKGAQTESSLVLNLAGLDVEARQRLRLWPEWPLLRNQDDIDGEDEILKQNAVALWFSFGEDLAGASLIISALLRDVYRVSDSEKLDFKIWFDNDDGVDDSEEKEEGTCLSGATLVMTPTGLVPLCSLSAGSRIFTRVGSAVSVEKVDRIVQHAPVSIWSIKCDVSAPILSATGNHRVLTRSNGWAKVRDLRVNDELLDFSGNWKAITSIEKSRQRVAVYNLYLKSSHQFFANMVVVSSFSRFFVCRVIIVAARRLLYKFRARAQNSILARHFPV